MSNTSTPQPRPIAVTHAAEQYVLASTQASAVARSLGLAAIGLVWLFGGGLTADKATPEQLLANIRDAGWLYTALIAALVALVLDLLQYVWGTLAWSKLHRVLNDVLERDDGTAEPVGEVDTAWRRARRYGVVDQIELAEDFPEEPDWNKRRDRARKAVTTKTPSESITKWLAQPVSPGLVRRASFYILAAKILALVVCYVSIGWFVLTPTECKGSNDTPQTSTAATANSSPAQPSCPDPAK